LAIAPARFRQQIKAATLGPVYLIAGDDEVEKARLIGELAASIEETLQAFNVERLYGGEADVAEILDAARTLPVAVPRRIVIVLRAERLLTPKRESEGTARDVEAFEGYIQNPASHATLVLVPSEPLDERRRVVKLLLKHAALVLCAGVADAGEAMRWIRGRMKDEGRAVDPEAVRLLAERAGTDIGRLRGDVERVLLYTLGERTITAEHVRDVTSPAVSQDDWAVTRAIGKGAPGAALKELGLLLEAGAVPYMVLGQLAWYVRTKLPPASAAAAVEAVFRTDLALKTSGGDPRILLERLVVELCSLAGSAPEGPPGRRWR
jgi:DNA polymerase III subunit delta